MYSVYGGKRREMVQCDVVGVFQSLRATAANDRSPTDTSFAMTRKGRQKSMTEGTFVMECQRRGEEVHGVKTRA